MKTKIIEGFEFKFSRRRYPRQTFTWVWVRVGDEWMSLGDPWPCVVPAKAQLLKAAKEVLQ